MKVLLFTNDLLPFGDLPTTRRGLRAFQLLRALENSGVEVELSMPGIHYRSLRDLSQIPERYRSLLWTFDSQDKILEQTSPDAVIFTSDWEHYNLQRKPSLPVILDLVGTQVIKAKVRERALSAERKVSVLSQADCLLVSSSRQRLYYYGWLVQSGKIPVDPHFIRCVPFSLPPEQPQRVQVESSLLPTFLCRGGWSEHKNQARAVEVVCREVLNRARGVVEICGSPKARVLTPGTDSIRLIYERLNELAESSGGRIRMLGPVGRNVATSIARRATATVELMQYNIERELAFPTRTIEHLWCGTPIISDNYSELSQLIRNADAGWTVDPASEGELVAVVEEIFDSPQAVARKSANALRLAQERFTWTKTISPLLEFLRNSTSVPASEPVLGAAYSRPTIFTTVGEKITLPVSQIATELTQRFILPTENVSALKLQFRDIPQITSDAEIETTVSRLGGRKIAKSRCRVESIRRQQSLEIPLPTLFPPRGGEELVLKLRLIQLPNSDGSDEGRSFGIVGVRKPSYPLVGGAVLGGLPKAEGVILGPAIDLSFLPAEMSENYRLKVLLGRAVSMVRKGEWKRVTRAISRRIPVVYARLRARTAIPTSN